MSPWAGIAIVLAALAGAFALLRLLQVVAAPHPEILRKLMHVFMGLVTAGFPWLFDDAWPVLLLASSSLLALVLLRGDFALTRPVQGVLHGVERSSWGELLFPLAVAIVFLLADGDPLLYCVPILVLTLADAVAALIGVYYGQLRYTTLEGRKSVEGSLAFFIVTFLCVHVALLLFSDVGRAESLLIGLLMGVIVMMFEAVAWRGLDNLFIPVGSFVLLESYLDASVPALVLRLVVILLLGLALLLSRHRNTLDDSTTLGAVLVAYGAWAVGGLYWLLVPASVFILSTALALRQKIDDQQQIHTVYALLGVTAPGLVWLVLDRNQDSIALFFAYAMAWVAHHTMLAVSRAHYGRPRLAPVALLPAILQGLVLLLLPFLLMWGFDERLPALAAFGAIVLGLCAFAFLKLQPQLDKCPPDSKRWTRQGLIAVCASMLAWGAVEMGWLGELRT